MLALRDFIGKQDPRLTEAWKYSMPFFCFKEKMFCYLWVNKKTGDPYVGFVDGRKLKHPDLVVEKRMRMKILPIDPKKDIPVRKISAIVREAISLRGGA